MFCVPERDSFGMANCDAAAVADVRSTPRKETRKQEKPVPEIIYCEKNKRNYQRGRLLGKGGFARCYELTDPVTRNVFAGKIICKSLLAKKHQKDKVGWILVFKM